MDRMKPYHAVSDEDIAAAEAIYVVDPLNKNPVQLWGQDVVSHGRTPGVGPSVLKMLKINRETLSDADEIELLYRVRAVKKRLPESVVVYLQEAKSKSFMLTNTYGFELAEAQKLLIELMDWRVLKLLHGLSCQTHAQGPEIVVHHATPAEAVYAVANPCCSKFEEIVLKRIMD
jgi:hypothetical protein